MGLWLRGGSIMATQHRPTLDTDNVPNADGRDRDLRKDRRPTPGAGHEPRGVQGDIADADKKVRTGSTEENVRNTPPFGEFEEPPVANTEQPGREDEKRMTSDAKPPR
jgi:hypothetical protein